MSSGSTNGIIRCVLRQHIRVPVIGELSAVMAQPDSNEFQATAGTRTAVPGAVACLQSAGNLLDWHPHVHLLISWGLFRRDGSFLPVEETPDPEPVARLFRHKVLRMLLGEGAIAEGGRPESPRVAPHGIRDTCQPGDPGGCDHAGDRRPLPAPAPITPERMLGEAGQRQLASR